MKKQTKLIIVESPAKIKTISKFLGPEYRIMSTFGHVKDLPSKRLGITIDEKTGKIDLEYEPIDDKVKKIADICKAASGCTEVYLASDPDREGEIISWHIGSEVEKVLKKTAHLYRITFNEITKPAVIDAIEHKSSINTDLVEAQQARRALDRWVGYEVSPILWRKIKKGLSAGRVQSAALLLVCNREEAIENFKPEETWSIHGTFSAKRAKITAELARISNKTFKLKNKKEADKALEDIKKHDYVVKDITVKARKKKPLPPFMTSTLQQASYNKLGFAVERTMRIAQTLYEGIPLGDPNKPEALITYMRTDSLRLSDTALKAGRGFIKKNFGDKYLPSKSNLYSKAAAQDAHEAIRPINVDVTPEIAEKYLTKDQAKVYGLIWRRFVASQMTPAQYSQRQVTIEGGKYLFRVTGTTLVFDGFLKVYEVEDDGKTVKIAKEIEKDLGLNLDKLDPKQHFTQPPPRFNEASLVKEMEKEGIGRPSTYVASLQTIQRRKYVTIDKKRFLPTELGRSVNKMLTQNLPDLINIGFTAQMEEDLDKIAQGKEKRDKVLGVFYKKFSKDLEAFGGKGTKKEALKIELTCPDCKSELLIRFGKAGEFVGCSDYPECKFTSNFERAADGTIKLVEAKEPEESDIKCPNCGKNLITRMGRYGPFLACPGYPDCKYIHQEALKMPCPKCGSKVVQRRSARGSFWGCSGYPKCRFVVFGDVEETPCKECKSPFLVKTKTKDGQEIISCPEKECSYKVTS